MKITKRRLKIKAIWATIKIAPLIIPQELQIMYYKFYNALLEAWIKNPDIKW